MSDNNESKRGMNAPQNPSCTDKTPSAEPVRSAEKDNICAAEDTRGTREEQKSAAENADGAEEINLSTVKNAGDMEEINFLTAETVRGAGKSQKPAAENSVSAEKKKARAAAYGMPAADGEQTGGTDFPKKKRRTGAARILLFVIISLIIGLTVYRWNAERLAGNAMPMPFGFGMSVVLSGSMEPELSVNDLVIIAKSDSYEAGDTVVYQSQGDLIIHKIIETDGVTAVTQGTANNIPDEPIRVEAIKGKLVLKLPKIGLAVRGIRTPIGVVIILAAAFFLLGRSYRYEKARDDAELQAIKAEIRRLRGE